MAEKILSAPQCNAAKPTNKLYYLNDLLEIMEDRHGLQATLITQPTAYRPMAQGHR